VGPTLPVVQLDQFHPALDRWSRPLAVALAIAGVAATVGELAVVVPKMQTLDGSFGVDFHQYLDHARRWLDGGGFYLPSQLAGPYRVYDVLPPLYPPPFLLLILPFLWLPQAVWWAVPLLTLAAVCWHWRPGPWGVAAIAWLVAWPRTYEIVLFGNPSLWIAAFAALGTVAAWPYVGVLLKPSLAPLALLGARHRSWWFALAAGLLISLPFGLMWVDYARALVNADQGWTYSLRDVPIVLIPVAAYAARTRPRAGAPGAP
jgi:hypothetical protein